MYYIGVDLGGTNIAVGIVDENYNIVKKGSVPTLADREADAIIADMANLAKKLLEECNISLDEVAYVGIASPGSVNPDTCVIEYANNLPFRDLDVSASFKKVLPVKKVLCANDANAAALGEAIAGAAKGVKDSVMITLGTGLGGGIIIDGKIYTGFNNYGAELGHVVVIHNGRQCSCGRKGCWEAYSSATGLINMTKEKMAEAKDSAMWDLCGGSIDKASGRTAFAAARQGDKAAQEVVDEYISILACGIVNMINIFQPEIFIIGGGVSGEGDNLLKPLYELVDSEQYGMRNDKKTQLKIATLGNDAGIIGGAVLGLQG